jgi:ABC-type nitrate/sulfonate/bicarbonate transport system permease component
MSIVGTDPGNDEALAVAPGLRTRTRVAERSTWSRIGRVARGVGQLVLTSAIMLTLWIVFLKVCKLSPLVGKGPSQVWAYLFSGPTAAAHRSVIGHGLQVTLADAGIGFAAGLTAGVLVALAFAVAPPLEQTFLPVALMVRSVPFIAMTPVIVLVFGRGVAAVAVISGLVVFFPALINIAFGLRSANRQTTDVVRAYGGGTWALLSKVAVPSALPAFFAAARIGVPGAFIGALLAEWLATGRGLGYRMLADGTTFQYDDLWASVVALTLVCTVLYLAVGVLQSLVLARVGPNAGRAG